MADTPSPLSEAKPDSIAELMARDPLSHTRESRDAIVTELRRQRFEFSKEEAKPKKTRGAKLEKVEGKINLSDLGL